MAGGCTGYSSKASRGIVVERIEILANLGSRRAASPVSVRSAQSDACVAWPAGGDQGRPVAHALVCLRRPEGVRASAAASAAGVGDRRPHAPGRGQRRPVSSMVSLVHTKSTVNSFTPPEVLSSGLRRRVRCLSGLGALGGLGRGFSCGLNALRGGLRALGIRVGGVLGGYGRQQRVVERRRIRRGRVDGVRGGRREPRGVWRPPVEHDRGRPVRGQRGAVFVEKRAAQRDHDEAAKEPRPGPVALHELLVDVLCQRVLQAAVGAQAGHSASLGAASEGLRAQLSRDRARRSTVRGE
mmetsp:Transcript_18390/g.54643  ORF Transcript_18390/g.54643 Transcript_18390/m.54643 type:complete len:297 (+) Transcript_18390:48-938(+)